MLLAMKTWQSQHLILYTAPCLSLSLTVVVKCLSVCVQRVCRKVVVYDTIGS